jgi:O-antigen/teichoic acid export membrane protein
LLKKLFKESVVYGLSRYIGKFISVFLLPLYTAMLSPEDYGILDLLGTITVVSIFLIISGTDTALGYFYYRKEFSSEKREMVSTALWLRIIFSFAVFVIIMLFAKNLSFLIFGRDYSLFIIITGLTIIFSSIYSFLFDLLRFEIKPWLYTIISTGVILAQILLNIYFVLILKKGVYGVLVANGIGYFIFFSITIFYVFKNYGAKLSKIWGKRIFTYGFPLIGTGIAVWILSSSDRYFLAHYADLSAVGIYAVGMKIASFLGMIAGAIQLAWGPFAANIQYEPNAKDIYKKVFLLFFLINVIAVFFISMFSIDILKVFTQPAYYTAKAVVPFLCFATVLQSGYFIVCIGIGLTKKAQHTVWITSVAAAVNLVMNFFLTPLYGALGASFSLMIAYALIFILTLIMSQKNYPIPYTYEKVLAIFIPAAIIIGVTYYYNIKILPRIIISLVFSVISGFYLYRTYKDSEEFKSFFNKVKKIRIYTFKQPDRNNIDI